MDRRAVLLVAVLTVGCGALRVGGAASFDAGTLGVSGVATGVGGQIEVLAYSRRDGSGFGAGPAVQLVGFTSDGDGDPIVFTTMEARYRKLLSKAYVEFGGGLGAAWSPGVQRAALPLHVEFGVRHASGAIEFTAAARERFLALIGSGSPPADAHNSVQLVLGVSFVPGTR